MESADISHRLRFEKLWDLQGKALADSPRWAAYRSRIRDAFPSPFRSDVDPLVNTVADALRRMNELRPAEDGPAYLGTDPSLNFDMATVKDAAIPKKMGEFEEVVHEIVGMFEGAPHLGHPLSMCNVIPQPNRAALIAAMMAQVYMPNYMEGEYSWNVHRAELESAGMLARLFGWHEPAKAGAIYTYGGSGCWMYAVKYALARVLPGSRQNGVRTDAKLICSQQAHYAQLISSDWSGLGMNNILRIPPRDFSNEMDCAELERVMQRCAAEGTPIACIVCTMGTTDANAFDPARKVRDLIEKYPNPKGFGKTFLYCDAVVGWSWNMFQGYDFANNPLQFSPEVLPFLARDANSASDVQVADAVGVDFHKTGWAPYVCSAFVYKNAAEMETLLRRPESPYLQVRAPYNPMDYSLEVSRSAAGALAGWSTLKYLGQEGFQAILGGILELKLYLRSLIAEQVEMVTVNPDDYGLCTLFRAYSKGVDAALQYERELFQPSSRKDLIANNMLTRQIGDRLWDWFIQGKRIDGLPTPHVSFSTGFRAADYNRDGSDPEAVVFALKAFPMNVHIDAAAMRHVVKCVLAARDEVAG